MRQYTNELQTAKLIELGFDKPKSIRYPKNEMEAERVNTTDFLISDYSIGELIEMLPKSLKNPYNPPLTIEYNNGMWRVYYGVQEDYSWEWSIWYEEERNELIDALYLMLAKLKEEGVIWCAKKFAPTR